MCNTLCRMHLNGESFCGKVSYDAFSSNQLVWPLQDDHSVWRSEKLSMKQSTSNPLLKSLEVKSSCGGEKNSQGTYSKLAELHALHSSQSSNSIWTAFWLSMKTHPLNMQIFPHELPQSYTVSTTYLQICAFLKKSEPKCHNLSSSLKERWSEVQFAAMDICYHISHGMHPAYDYVKGNVTHPFITHGTVPTSSLWH